LPLRGCLVGDVYIPALREGARLEAFEYAGPFDDIGSPRAYLDANLRWLAALRKSAYVGEGSRVSDRVELRGVVVGAGAVVEGRGLVERSVVWPGSRVCAPLADAIVAPNGVVCVGGSAGR
jgi:mannose-1-phosphate guanylyltransferase